MSNIWKQITFGLLSWFIPFVVSFFFVGKGGNFLIDETFFKSIMVVTGALTGVILSAIYFKKVENKFVKEGLQIGFIWLIINILLDMIMVLNGFFDMSVAKYFTNIGLRYLSIPIFTVGAGFMIQQHLKKRVSSSVG